jgi:hypothetical protein
VVSEIRIYVEGGGDCRQTKNVAREGFSSFLKDIVQLARSKRIRWQIVVCGSRDQTFSDFVTALETHSDAFNVLLVDSEAPVHHEPWQHLRERDTSWSIPAIGSEHCHLMVQMMEAWFVADIDALHRYYGQGFLESAIPRNPNVEEIDKERLESALKNATRHTSKGEYRKRHGLEILKQINPTVVRQAAPHCDRLFVTLIGKIADS